MYEYGIDVKKKVNNHFFFLVLQINLNLAVSKKQKTKSHLGKQTEVEPFYAFLFFLGITTDE